MGNEDPQAEDAGECAPRADDFKRIQGIGPVIEEHLHDAGIRTYAQLAALSPEDIVRLVENLPLLSVERIAKQDWPGRARALAAPSALGDEGAAPETRQRYATFTVELSLDNLSQVLQTSVMHIQDGEEDSWAGWDAARLMSFFAEYAAIYVPSVTPEPAPGPAAGRVIEPDLLAAPLTAESQAVAPTPPPSEAPAAPPAVSPATQGPTMLAEPLAGETPAALRLEVGDILLDEVPLERSRGGQPPIRRLRAQLDFRLTGVEAAHVAAEGVFYAVQVVACNLATGQTTVLAVSRDRLVSGQLDYAPAVEFALPDDGRYQLVGIVLLRGEHVVGNVLGPVLRVTR